MEKAQAGQTIQNDIETYFYEFFEMHGIELSSKTPQSQIEAGFSYVYENLFKPADLRPYNRTTINVNDIDKLYSIYNTYKNICKLYNIIPFVSFFTSLTGISNQTIYNWYHKDTKKDVYINTNSNLKSKYSGSELSNLYFELAKNIITLPKSQTHNKLADKDLGVTVLANNDVEIGLEYNGKRQLEEAAARQVLSGTDLKTLISGNNANLLDKMHNENTD